MKFHFCSVYNFGVVAERGAMSAKEGTAGVIYTEGHVS
jgi:hypothetical protein